MVASDWIRPRSHKIPNMTWQASLRVVQHFLLLSWLLELQLLPEAVPVPCWKSPML